MGFTINSGTETEKSVAQRIQTFIIDDLDGTVAEDKVLFGLDGAQYEIDLSADHARELRTALARYVKAGRKITAATRRPSRNGRKAAAGGISNAEARIWAKANGLAVKERGRVSADILARYQAATGSQS
jgi:predicted RNA-binding protein with PUA domain